MGSCKIGDAHSLSEYIECLSKFVPKCFGFRVQDNVSEFVPKCFGFRGQGNVKYDLSPSICRKSNSQKEEREYIMDLVTKYPTLLSPRDHFGTISILRHHELPARLLDISWNPLIALYMALCSENKDDKDADAAVYIIPVDKEKKKYSNSDTVLALSSLAFISDKDRTDLAALCRQMANRNNAILDEFAFIHMDYVHRLYHEIRGEYPAYECEIRVRDLMDYFFALPSQKDRRMIAQQGFFILFGLDIPNNVQDITNRSYRIVIPCACKKAMLTELELCGIDEATVYPDINSDVRMAKKD